MVRKLQPYRRSPLPRHWLTGSRRSRLTVEEVASLSEEPRGRLTRAIHLGPFKHGSPDQGRRPTLTIRRPGWCRGLVPQGTRAGSVLPRGALEHWVCREPEGRSRLGRELGEEGPGHRPRLQTALLLPSGTPRSAWVDTRRPCRRWKGPASMRRTCRRAPDRPPAGETRAFRRGRTALRAVLERNWAHVTRAAALWG